MRSRFAACVRAPSAPLRGAGAPMRKSASKKEAQRESDSGEIGVIVESSPNRTLGENQNAISMLRKRSFVRRFGLGLKNQGLFVA